MGGGNCAFFGCPTSGKHEISLFKIPTVKVSDGEHTKESKPGADPDRGESGLSHGQIFST